MLKRDTLRNREETGDQVFKPGAWTPPSDLAEACHETFFR
jgi:hypothetical protein